MPYIKQKDFVKLLHLADAMSNQAGKASRVSALPLTVGQKCSIRSTVKDYDDIRMELRKLAKLPEFDVRPFRKWLS